jgi:Methyltransferase domain
VSDWQQVAETAVGEHGAQQKAGELARLLGLLAAAGPQVILEIGSDAGGTLYAWSQLPSAPRVIAVSLPGQAYAITGHGPELHGAELAEGDSHDPRTLAQVRDMLSGQLADVLFIDADHTYAAARADFETFTPLLRPGGLAVFHDICGIPDVRRLWDEVRAGATHSEIVTGDGDWGGFGILAWPGGRGIMAEQKKPAAAEAEEPVQTPAEQAAAQVRVLLPAGGSPDPHVHQVLAERQTAVLNGDAAAIAAADRKLADLGVT